MLRVPIILLQEENIYFKFLMSKNDHIEYKIYNTIELFLIDKCLLTYNENSQEAICIYFINLVYA